MVEHFEVGCSYRWIGPPTFGVYEEHNFNEDMQAWLDGAPRICLDSDDDAFAKFEGIDGGHWSYHHCLEHFELVAAEDVDTTEVPGDPLFGAAQNLPYRIFYIRWKARKIHPRATTEQLVGKLMAHASDPSKYGIITRLTDMRVYYREPQGNERFITTDNALVIVDFEEGNVSFLREADNYFRRLGTQSASSVLVERPPYRWRDFFGVQNTIEYGTRLGDGTFMEIHQRLPSESRNMFFRILKPKTGDVVRGLNEYLDLTVPWHLCPVCGSVVHGDEETTCPACELAISLLPICAVCHEPLPENQQWFGRRTGGRVERICLRCGVGEVACTECGTSFIRHGPTDPTICPSCVSSAVTCEFCGRQAHKRHMVLKRKMYSCETCEGTKRMGGYHGTMARSSPTFMGQPEPGFPLFLGIELEVDCDHRDGRTAESRATCSQGPVAVKIQEMMRDLKVESTSDGSLSQGIEFVSHPMTIEKWRETKPRWHEMTRALVKYGYRGHDAKTAGLHVHVSRAAFKTGDSRFIERDSGSQTAYFRLAFLMKKFESELLRFSRRKQDRKDQYAKALINSRTFQTINGLASEPSAVVHFYENSIRGDRYVELNSQFPATFEFRLFRSTLNTDTLIATIELVYLLCKYVTEVDWATLKATTWSSLIDRSPSPELKTYNERIMRTASPSEDGVEPNDGE